MHGINIYTYRYIGKGSGTATGRNGVIPETQTSRRRADTNRDSRCLLGTQQVLRTCLMSIGLTLLLFCLCIHIHRLSEEKTLFNLDLTVQLLLKQGQVEVDEGDFVPDYSESVLVHRRVIEDLNKEIKV